MIDVILVLNAGSSSIKFSAYKIDQGRPELDLHGKIEEIYTAPCFIARDASGESIGAKQWGAETCLGHEGAIAYLGEFLRSHRDGRRLVAVAHRVVHGGAEFSSPVRVDAQVTEKLERLIPLAPLHQPHNLKPIDTLVAAPPGPAAGRLLRHGVSPRPAGSGAGIRAAGFHHRTWRAALRISRPVLRIHRQRPARVRSEGRGGPHVVAHLGNGSSMCAMAGGKASRARWASPRSTACRWARAAAVSIPA